MDVLYGLPIESVRQVSPESLDLKKYIKVPLLIFATLPAMISSISELLMKIVGCVIKDAEEWSDWWWLLLFVPLLAATGILTLIYINYGIKYYDQMEVIPIYQTNLLIHNILVGMICLNELKFYSNLQLLSISMATLSNTLGIQILL